MVNVVRCSQHGSERCSRYCSKAAQKSDWNRGHKYECKALRSPHVRPMSMLRLVGRVLWKRAAEMKSKASATANDRDVDALTAAAGKASLDESMPSGSVEGKGNTEDNGLNFWHSFEAVAAMQGSNSIFAGVPRPAVLQLLGSLRYQFASEISPVLQLPHRLCRSVQRCRRY